MNRNDTAAGTGLLGDYRVRRIRGRRAQGGGLPLVGGIAEVGLVYPRVRRRALAGW